MKQAKTPAPARCGFTLIELLVVIAILGILMVALLPNVLGAREQGDIAETQARITFLQMAAKSYEHKYGRYPSDDFFDVDRKLKIRKDTENSGIESLVIFLCQKRLGSESLADHEDWLGNTDNDKNASMIPLLERTDKMEVLDSWQTPLVYFCSMNGGYTRRQTVHTMAGLVQVGVALNPRTGRPLGKGKFQIISAGPDGEFGNGDDITYPSAKRN